MFGKKLGGQFGAEFSDHIPRNLQTGTAPVGYRNLCTPEGKRYIGLDDKQAKIMKWVFNELSLGTYSSEQVFKRAAEMGLACKKNRFLVAIRSQAYIGKVLLPAYKDEVTKWIPGQHEALISEELFNDVQDILDGRKRKIKTTVYSHDMMPLRGFLKCSRCSRTLTSSASKGVMVIITITTVHPVAVVELTHKMQMTSYWRY